MIIYNSQRPEKTTVDPSICLRSNSLRNYRLAYIDEVYEREKGLRELLDHAPILDNHNKVLIDVKVSNLSKGQYSAVNKQWHLDGKINTKYPSQLDNKYHIITWGGAPTKFIDEPKCVNLYGCHQSTVRKILDLDTAPIYELEPFMYHTYGEYDWHKCGRATKDCTRAFIRIVESDYIKAQKVD